MIAAILALINPIITALKDAGILKDPAQQAALQQQLAQAAAAAQQAQADEFAAFLKATTPDASRVYVWANSMIAITRPAITWMVTGSIISSFFIPGVAAKLTATVAAFSQGGTAGLMILSIPLWWFAGRTAEKIWQGNGSDTVSAPAPKAVAAPVATPVTAMSPAAVPVAPSVPASDAKGPVS